MFTLFTTSRTPSAGGKSSDDVYRDWECLVASCVNKLTRAGNIQLYKIIISISLVNKPMH